MGTFGPGIEAASSREAGTVQELARHVPGRRSLSVSSTRLPAPDAGIGERLGMSDGKGFWTQSEVIRMIRVPTLLEKYFACWE
jgi:hypothetical protein